ncbi:ankyrin-3 [Fusarium mexicanum]|uniref:Ankyrin-3 n=1 Tax=Fusarium mexicanum TaxID=751941 RepID=A0A8H5MMM0_9HYPO|nr:ankyrin-3 [Fusarium mexicanum]
MPKSANTADEYDFVDHQDTALSPETVAELREWLQPTDYLAESSEYRRHLLSQAPGTGLWICESSEYRKWHDSPDHGSLWIKGVPGAGKSVMAASMIQHLRTTENCPVLFFFFRNIVAANFSPRALIQDWLAQLLPHSPKLQFALQSRLEDSLDDTSDNELIELFLDGVSCVPKLYCVGDALDEMSTDSTPILERLNGLATHRPRTLKLLMTSRPSRTLQSTLRDSSIVHISLQQRLVDVDIHSYLNHRFDNASTLEHHREAKKDLINMVAGKSQGLFLYAKLTMDQVEDSLRSDAALNIEDLEASLPVGLEQTYTSMLEKQRGEPGVTTDVQVLILEAVIHASRPLRLNELASLLKCVRPDITQPSAFKSLIATSCGPLIEILEDETLQVIHHSFTEFLRGDTRSASTVGASDFPIIDSLQAHKHMAMNCLIYLQSGSLLLHSEQSNNSAVDPSVTFETPRHKVDREARYYRREHLGIRDEHDAFEYRSARLQYPFLSYAVENWPYHASNYDVDDSEFFNTIMDFLSSGSLSFLRWLVLEWGSTSSDKGSPKGIPTGLHIAAFAGLTQFASQLLKQGVSASAVDAQERVPLHWAAANGHDKVAALLIHNGANPDAEDGRGLKPIHLATLKNYAKVVTVLLEAGVKPNTIKTRENRTGRLLGGERITKGECSIYYASRGGHLEVITAMMPFCEPQMLEQLLCQCCQFSRADAVQAILGNSPVSPNATYEGATALYFACAIPDVKIVEELIRAGADVNMVSQWQSRRRMNGLRPQKREDATPLHRLVEVWEEKNDSDSQKVLTMLLKAGADLERFDGRGKTPLAISAQDPRYSDEGGNHLPALKALVRAGANVKVIGQPPNTDTILHQVLEHSRDLEAIKLLVEHGCDPMQKNEAGHTSLHRAVSETGSYKPDTDSRRMDIVKYLLTQGADPCGKDRYGRTPLAIAMSGESDIFEALFERATDKSATEKCWFNLSGISDADRFTHYLELLLAAGIDMEMVDSNGNTLYLNCVRGGKERLRILKDHGARTDATDSNGNNALHRLCFYGARRTEEMEMFIEEGIDPLATNHNGDTLLHLVAKEYDGTRESAGLLGWLLSLGIPVNAVNNQGATPVHLFQTRRRTGSTLLDKKRIHFLDVLNRNGEVDLQIRDNDGLSPLHLAVMTSEVELAELKKLGLDFNYLTSDSQNLLHLACRARKTGIVAQILETVPNIDMNQQDQFGRTPLHYACSSGDPEIVAWLLRYGASTYIKANDDSSVLHACADIRIEQSIWNLQARESPWLRRPCVDRLRPRVANDYPREPWYQAEYSTPKVDIQRQSSPGVATTIEMLVEHGVDPGWLDDRKRTALDLALFAGCPDFAEVFSEDEELFKMATVRLEKENDSAKVEERRRGIKLQMLLMCPKSCWEVLRRDEDGFKSLMDKPQTFLSLLSTQDAARLMDQCVETAPLATGTYELLDQIMRPSSCQTINHLSAIEHAPGLIKYYSNYENAKARLEKEILEERWHPETLMTALSLACSQEGSNMLTLRLLVEKLKVDVNANFALSIGDRYDKRSGVTPGGTALHVLAEANQHWQLEGLRYLIENGANVNALRKDGQTPLHIAAGGLVHKNRDVKGLAKLEAVKILLDHGADINALDNSKLTPLHKASNAPDVTKELLSRGADATIGKESPLFEAIFDQNQEVLEALLKHGSSPDILSEAKHSRDVHYNLTKSRHVYPVLCAAFAEKLNTQVANSIPLLRTLIGHGANLYLPLNDDETLIHFLFVYPDYEVVDELLKPPCASQIDFNHRNQQGQTVLMAACNWRETLPGFSHRHWEKLPAGPPVRILDLGADATLVDNLGKTALHHLLSNPGLPDDTLIEFINRTEVAPTLFQADEEGYLPLHYALRLLRPRVCEALLMKGADLLQPDPEGRTALHYIASQCLRNTREPGSPGRLNIELGDDYFNQCHVLWKKFIGQGGSINVTDKTGNTPLHTYLSSPPSNGYGCHPESCHTDHFMILFPEGSGVDIFALNKPGEGALHMIAGRENFYVTVEGHDKKLFLLMMNKGLDPLKEDEKGRSALDIASACEKDDIVGLLGRK